MNGQPARDSQPVSRLRPCHLLRLHELIELLAGEKAQFQRRFAQAGVLNVRRVGYLGSFVIADFRCEHGHQHERVLYVPINLGLIDLDAFDHVLDVAVASIRDQSD